MRLILVDNASADGVEAWCGQSPKRECFETTAGSATPPI